MEDIADKVAFVTGGDSGIGLAIVKVLANAGVRVAYSYRREEHLRNARRTLDGETTYDPVPFRLDVTDREEFTRTADEIESKLGPVQILCNSAGVNFFGAIETSTYDDWDWVFGVNTGGVINSVVSFLPRMLQRALPGHIVNIGSMASYLSGPVAGIYTASKFAVRGISECLRYSLHKHGVGVSLVCPGVTKTNIHEAVLFRPKGLSQTEHPATDEGIENIRRIHASGVDPLVVAERVLVAIRENQPLVFTHPGYGGEFEEIYQDSVAALPDTLPSAEQLWLDNAFRDARKRALT